MPSRFLNRKSKPVQSIGFLTSRWALLDVLPNVVFAQQCGRFGQGHFGLMVCSLVLCGVVGCAEPQSSTDSKPVPSVAQTNDASESVLRSSRFTLKFENHADDHPEQVLVSGFSNAELSQIEAAELDDDGWNRLLAVSVATEDSSAPSMLGSYRIDKETLIFEPEYPLRHGLKYIANFTPKSIPGAATDKEEPLTIEFKLPARPKTKPTLITNVYPSRDILPENQLKFYIHFTAPMSRGHAYDRIHLLRESGEEVDLAFLELGEELWDPDGVRFTLFFDPGRIKRGLKPREELGPSIVEGRAYTLLIDAEWPDANGQPLTKAYRKSFKVIKPDDIQPAIKKWKITAPLAGSTSALEVRFAESLDQGMLERVLQVRNASGQFVDGAIEIEEFETLWKLTPQDPWKPGVYSLEVDTTLEDLAGNSLGKPFEVDVFEKIDRKIVPQTESITFSVLPK